MAIRTRRNFNERKPFNKQELFKFIDKFEIEMDGDLLITKFDGRIVKSVSVSNRYEIFDFRSYLKDKIALISENFEITEYSHYFTGGIQEIRLFSDKVTIGEDVYEKCFYFLNSTDKTRVLNMNLGFYNRTKDVYFAFSKSEFSLRKKHLTGVTEAANSLTIKFSEQPFDEEIKAMKSLLNHSVKLSKIQEILVQTERESDTNSSGHLRFDAFKTALERRMRTNKNEQNILRTSSESLEKKYSGKDGDRYDFYVDAYDTFVIYTSLFAYRDSYTIAKETERILNITQQMIRNTKLDALFSLLDEKLDPSEIVKTKRENRSVEEFDGFKVGDKVTWMLRSAKTKMRGKITNLRAYKGDTSKMIAKIKTKDATYEAYVSKLVKEESKVVA
jgi:hypothetical protein